ncbi:hypothetical protein Hdeb2414_s0009g00303921 [Helianthus debilis subsp. tardiflorus]
MLVLNESALSHHLTQLKTNIIISINKLTQYTKIRVDDTKITNTSLLIREGPFARLVLCI